MPPNGHSGSSRGGRNGLSSTTGTTQQRNAKVPLKCSFYDLRLRVPLAKYRIWQRLRTPGSKARSPPEPRGLLLRRYESSCHSRTQKNKHRKYTQYMHADVLYTCCVTHFLCDVSLRNPCSVFDVPRQPCVLGLAPLCPSKLAILGRKIPES